MSDILNEKVATLETTVNELNEKVADLETENGELKTALEAATAAAPKAAKKAAKGITVSIDKKKYTFKYPRFNVGKKDYLAADVAKDKNLCAQLLASNPGIFIAK